MAKKVDSATAERLKALGISFISPKTKMAVRQIEIFLQVL